MDPTIAAMVLGIVAAIAWMLLGIATANLLNRVYHPRKKGFEGIDIIVVMLWPVCLLVSLLSGLGE